MQSGFFDLDNRYAQLNKLNDPLIELNRVIDWELFRAPLSVLSSRPRKSAAGRKPIDRVLLFKMLVLQRLYNLADEALEYQVKDRLSFMRFLGLGLAASVPDAKTLWVFREELKEHRLTEDLFDRFHECLRVLGVELKSGQIVDATFVTVPIQRNSREENALLKEGATPIEWGKNPRKLAQKDTARAGPRRTARASTDTRITSTWIGPPSWSRHGKTRQRRCTTARCWRMSCAIRKKGAPKFTRTAPTVAKNRKPGCPMRNTSAGSARKGRATTP